MVEGSWVSECLRQRRLVDDAHLRVPFGTKAKLLQERALAQHDDAAHTDHAHPPPGSPVDADVDDSEDGAAAPPGPHGAVAPNDDTGLGATPPDLDLLLHTGPATAQWERSLAASSAPLSADPARTSPSRTRRPDMAWTSQMPGEAASAGSQFATSDYARAEWSDHDGSDTDVGDSDDDEGTWAADVGKELVLQQVQVRPATRAITTSDAGSH